MSAHLAYSVVLADGSIAEGGTKETPELRKKITNPLAWGEQPEDDDKADESAKAPAKKSK